MEEIIQEALSKGIELHVAGEYDLASQLYESVLKVQPDHADANHNMGVLKLATGHDVEALSFLQTALQANTSCTEFWLSYVKALIKLERLDEAGRILDLAKESSIESEEFVKLNQLINTTAENAVIVEPEVDTPSQSEPNILDSLKLNQALRLAEKKANEGNTEEAKRIYKDILAKFPKNKQAQQGLAAINRPQQSTVNKNPPENTINNLINLYNQGQLSAAIEHAKILTQQYPDAFLAWNVLGAAAAQTGQLDEAIIAFQKVIAIKPDYADAYSNMGNALKEKGELENAIQAYSSAISIRPDFAEAYNNMGTTLQEQGKLEEAIEAYNKALSIKPDYAEAWNNIIFPLQAMKSRTSLEKDHLPVSRQQANCKYSQVAETILNYRLNGGSPSIGQHLQETLSLLSSTDNTFIKNPKESASELVAELTPPENITALVHFGRSGTGLLHSLIDGHPEVSTLPSIYFSEFFDPSTWEKIIAGGWDEILTRFMATYEVLFDAASAVKIATKSGKFIESIGRKEGMASVGEKGNEVLHLEKNIFYKELKRLMDCHDRLDAITFFKLVHSAYDRIVDDSNKKSLIFYHIHNPSTLAQLNFLRSVPNVNWLMMVREPVQSCESWVQKSFLVNDYKMIANIIFQMLFEVDDVVFRNTNSIGVRLEDLKEHPNKTIPAICDWLEIKQQDSLYEMTAQGKKWWGDPSSPDFKEDGMKPFCKTSINRKLGSVFSKKDQFILGTLFYPFSVRFGYAKENKRQFKANLKTIRPMMDQIFDFESAILERTQVDKEQFMKSGAFLYLRSGMIERWNTLNEFHTYNNMLQPLRIDSSDLSCV